MAVDNTQVKANVLAKMQSTSKQLLIAIASFNEAYALYNAIPLNTTGNGSDVNAYQDPPATPNDFGGVYSQMNRASFGALVANLNTWITNPTGSNGLNIAALMGQMRIMVGNPPV
jgi:hypothetical protein